MDTESGWLWEGCGGEPGQAYHVLGCIKLGHKHLHAGQAAGSECGRTVRQAGFHIQAFGSKLTAVQDADARRRDACHVSPRCRHPTYEFTFGCNRMLRCSPRAGPSGRFPTPPPSYCTSGPCGRSSCSAARWGRTQPHTWCLAVRGCYLLLPLRMAYATAGTPQLPPTLLNSSWMNSIGFVEPFRPVPAPRRRALLRPGPVRIPSASFRTACRATAWACRTPTRTRPRPRSWRTSRTRARPSGRRTTCSESSRGLAGGAGYGARLASAGGHRSWRLLLLCRQSHVPFSCAATCTRVCCCRRDGIKVAISFVIAAINAMLVFLLRVFKFNVEKHWTTTGTELRWVGVDTLQVWAGCGVRCSGYDPRYTGLPAWRLHAQLF